ncbi:MAG TPA: STAS domain-containing protein [Symbiobacteriaceae bacterium]|nr:STAS domain-containing protein [Symbiobacteriaceae bacterium]
MLKLAYVERGDLLTIKIEGELALETTGQFQAMTQHIRPEVRRVELDCRALSFIDSTGVNALLKVVLQLMQTHEKVDITNMADELEEMLSVMGFFEVLADQQ